MKIDRKFRKTLSEIPNDCKQLIEKLKSCQDNDQLLTELCAIKSWNIGKCELYHWADVLDRFNSILEQSCAHKPEQSWQLACDLPENIKLKTLVLAVLQFTALLIEHSYSRHLYNSIEHLTTLLESTDFLVILSVLNLLYVFSKRSIFINRLSNDKKQALVQRLLYLAESWGGKENGLDLIKCCLYTDLNNFPSSATAVNFEYTVDTSINPSLESKSELSILPLTTPSKTFISKHVKLEKVHLIHENPAVIMEHVLKDHPDIPEDKRVLLYTYIRLAHSFPNYEKRKLFVQTRLQSLSILVYSGAIQEHNNLLYDGLIEELVDVLTVKDTVTPIPPFPEIKAASLKTLTAIIHLEKTIKLTEIIETTQAASYHGLLPTLVRKCVDHLIDPTKEPFPHQFATSLFSFLYHLATYDTGGDALVKCGIMETLLKVVNHNHNSQEFIMFVTRAVRVIDLITNLDMSSFESHNGLVAFINRLEYEVNECRKEQPYVIKVKKPKSEQMEEIQGGTSMETESLLEPEEPVKIGLTCYHQRSALLKSILNFFKKAIADSANNNIPNLGDSIRHMMDNSLPDSLKHIISNADYYGPSLFLLAIDVVQLFIFQEPSQLSQLQENGLTDVILFALLKKNVPATREVLGSLPTVFSALCLNTAGLNAFIESKPFDKLFQVLLSPDYLPAMRRRRNAEQVNGANMNGVSSSSGTASQLGTAMDELMRHQPSLRIEAINSIINLLNRLIEMGKNPNYLCQRQSSNSSQSSSKSTRPSTTTQPQPSTSAQTQNQPTQSEQPAQVQQNENTQQSSDDENNMDDYDNMIVDTDQTKQAPKVQVPIQPESIPLLDYITNIMKFIEAILSHNSTDDHCKEFVKQKGLIPLLEILTLPNLPIDFPSSTACQSVSQVCKAILNLAREGQVVEQALQLLSKLLNKSEKKYDDYILKRRKSRHLTDGSVLLAELAQNDNPQEAVNQSQQTPLLHSICSIHSLIYLLITLGKINQNDVRNIIISKWGSSLGVNVLKDLSKLYSNLIWESSMLLWLCNEEQQQNQLQQLVQIQQLNQMTGEQNQNAVNQLNTLIKQLSSESSVNTFEFNKSDLEKLKMASSHETETMESSETKLPVSYGKLLRPLFNCSSKLGRSLCEMFGLMVKLSAGSWKSTNARRNMISNLNPNTTPSENAINVATSLAEISISGFSTSRFQEEKSETFDLNSLHPKFRLTFYICSTGFTSSILFDEQKRPYHLMIQRFDQLGGLKALFDVFYWAVSLLTENKSEDKDRLQEGTLEFIEAWLQLIQKLVNTKNMLETRYSLSQASTTLFSTNPEIKKVCSFDPIKFLFKIQKEAFQALMCLWDNKSFIIRENYTLSETVLNILCQILVGDSQLQKKLTEQQQQQQQAQTTTNTLASSLRASFQSRDPHFFGLTNPTSTSQPAAPVTNPTPTRQLTPMDQDIISQMIAMGFPAELAQDTVIRGAPDSLEQAVEYCCNQQNQPSTSSTDAARPSNESEPMSNDDNQEQTRKNEDSLTKEKSEPEAKEENYQLDKEILDKFASTMLPGLMKILDNVPDCVYRVCELIVVVVGKYGDEWRDNCLSFILNETLELIRQVSEMYSKQDADKKMDSFIEQRLASRLLLFCLLFEEMQLPCSKIVNSSNLLEKCVSMLQMITNSSLIFKQSAQETTTSTPVWLTSLFILVDLIEKAALSTRRKAAINEQFKSYQRVWKWYEERQNRWIQYAQANNKTIDQAYKNGETSVRIVASRKHYVIHFNTMLQENEETFHKRPVMLSFEKPINQSSDTEMSAVSRPSTPLPTEVVHGLQPAQISAVIESCVELISWPVSDSDCLHAILRLILRLTRQHEYAIEFAARKGPQYILNLTQKNSFMGYASLITLIFRHICEDEKNLRLTMEKAIRLALTGSQVNIAGLQPGSIGARELNNVLRLLGPAICRHPDLFCEVACDILRIIIRREDETIINTSNIQTLEKPIEQQLSNNTAYCLRTVAAKLMPPTSMPDYAKELVIDLLNYLIKSEKRTDNKDTKNKNNSQPLTSKSGVLRILSELVRSYAGCARVVSGHVYKMAEIGEECNALAFLLDNLLASNQTFGDKDCPSLCRLLIVALASCNHCLESQNALVQEVKLALNRAVNLPESNDKHIKIQAFASIINTMIETCPPIHNPSQQQQQQQQNNQQSLSLVNNMMKIMHKKGLINDLARVPLYMDLSCSKSIETINTILKPLETMTKTLNISARKGFGPKPVERIVQTVQPIIVSEPEPAREVIQVAENEREITAQHTGVTTDITGLNLAEHDVVSDASGSVLASETNRQEEANISNVDLNMTEMEPQQTLPQDVDMLPSSTHHHRRELEERAFDRVIEAFENEEDEVSESDSDSEYESQDRIIHIEADNDGNQIHIEIGHGDDDDEDEDDEEDALGLPGSAHEILNNSSGESDNESENETDFNNRENNENDEDDEDDEEEETEVIETDEEDDDEDIIEEEIVEGSDGRSAESDLSEDEQNASNRNQEENLDAQTHQDGGVIMDVGGVLTTNDENTVGSRQRRRRRHRHHEEDEEENETDYESEDEDLDEDMDLDEEGEIQHGEQIIEEDEDENEENDEDDEDEDEDEEEEADEENEDEEESEYFDAYNQMLDFINDENGENGEEDEFLTHIENLWQNHGGGNQPNHIVFGSGNTIGISSNTDGTVPPHPLSVSAVHPLLVNHSESTTQITQPVSTSSGFQVTGLQLPTTTLPNIGSSISPILRTMRQLQQQGGTRAGRISRFVLPPIQLQSTSQTNITQPTTTTPAIRAPTLPYNTLNEILQGFENPASALQPSVFTAPTTGNIMEFLTGTTTTQPTAPAPSTSVNAAASNTALANMNNPEFLVNLNSYNNDGFGENIGNGTTNLYIIRTPLARWNEECTVLDSHSMHNAILLNKPKIMEALEKYRNDELNEKREKKLKEEREKLKKQAETRQEAELVQQTEIDNQNQVEVSSNNNPQGETNRMEEEPIENTTEPTPIEQPTVQPVEPTPPPAPVEQAPPAMTYESEVDREAVTNFMANFVGTTCSIFTLSSSDERRIAIEALRMAEQPRASLELQAATSDETQYPQNYVFLDGHVVEIPSGIDPSFLSALPDSLRREVIMEQLRILGIDIRNRPIPQTIQATTTATTTTPAQPEATSQQTTSNNVEINPEFLAALPPQIQEELLTQQRIEQQARQAASTAQGEGTSGQATATPAEDDNAAFMRTLPASLRQAILFDMDHSQISALPEDLATEARALQQQHREREIDLFAAAHRTGRVGGNGNSYISSLGRGYRITSNRGLEGIYNVASSLLNDTYVYGGGQSRDLNRLRRNLRHLNEADIFFGSSTTPTTQVEKTKTGRQLLDHESIACLLVLLFIDDPRMHMTKLHRVVRNLCIHSPSRTWIIKALLCILEKVSGKPENNNIQEIHDSKQTPSRSSKQLTKSPGSSKENQIVSYQPSWLTMSIDGAFGSKTNVFTILKSNSNSKKLSSSKLTPSQETEKNIPSILINQQACPAILKQILEILSTLARVANFNFFPRGPMAKDQPAQSGKAHAASKSHFWDIVVKLDQSKNKHSKLSQTSSQMNQIISEFDSDLDFNVENSPLARLMSALDYPVLKNNPNLMDKMFTCLSYASSGIPQMDLKNLKQETEEYLNNQALLSKQIELVVNVLKKKLCTQDGLQQAYTLLNNLSKINSATRNLILKHLLKGTRELGLAVCKEIETLLDEAIKYNQTVASAQPIVTGDESMDSATNPTTSLLASYTTRPSGSSTQQNLIDSYSNLVISSPKTKQTRELQLPSMSVLVEKNSNQKFFVRLIRLIISLRETIEKEAKKKRSQVSTDAQTPQEPIESLPRLSTELDLDELWDKLSECLTTLKSLSDPYAVLILQQTVEGFFYVHATRKDKDETRKREKETKETQLSHLDTETAPMSPHTSDLVKEPKTDIEAIIESIGTETSPDTKKFLEFALTHRTVLNHILRQTSNNLSEEPYSVLVDFTRMHTHILDFDVKRRFFRQELDKLKDSIRGVDLAIHVRRNHVFDDSFRELNRRSPDDWKHRFYIVFEGEEGQDAGGLLREWYMIISKEIFNPDYALFMINPGDRVTYMPNPSSHCNPNHLSYFKFIGHIIAKAIFDNKFLDCYFTRAFYKHILGVPVKYTDMESVDNEFYKNLVSILESDIESFGIDLYFTIDINEFGVTQSRDLKPNGKNIKVTNEDKQEYVRLVCQEKMIGSIRQQVSAFLQGFYEIIPKSLISIFNEQELELLISGLPEIDLEDLRRNTEYHKYNSNSLQIQWFWRALKSFDKEDQAKFLQFVTGTSKVPLQGFAKLEGMNGPQKFQIHRDDRDTSRLPCAHTCFNQLDLPAYEDFEKLKSMLLMAIRECSTGFGLA
ncbi:unnamed protein product [Brachionus calyciflorus]|uniref:HECT-type E3 ubiquitin transferase n=1 Tax=Brachionus calyciflorus TaxID=104777 RepID=A0A813RK95_9BILA|nr:unnamed protein product [Brachionus calyciflorus]